MSISDLMLRIHQIHQAMGRKPRSVMLSPCVYEDILVQMKRMNIFDRREGVTLLRPQLNGVALVMDKTADPGFMRFNA